MGNRRRVSTRRDFLKATGGIAALGAVTGLVGIAPVAAAGSPSLVKGVDGETPDGNRTQQAYKVRIDAARYERDLEQAPQPLNGDEALYPNHIASYSKGLPHNSLGEVDDPAYNQFVAALQSGSLDQLNNITLGSTPGRKLVNPLAAFAFQLEGPDSHHVTSLPPPTFASAQSAAEIAENYWMALTRDIPFAGFAADGMIRRACDDLSKMSDFRAPKQGGKVTPSTLFRVDWPGVMTGPYVSQFLLQDLPMGAYVLKQLMTTAVAGLDYMTNYQAWLDTQNGAGSPTTALEKGFKRYILNGRDLGQWVHVDQPSQGPDAAVRILLKYQTVPWDKANPYIDSKTQQGSVTFGQQHIQFTLGVAAQAALKAVYYYKWLVHRNLRPEAFGGRIHNHLSGKAVYPIHQDILGSDALVQTFNRTGTYLLPMAYAEGCPTHPSYPAAHAINAGACVTLLKAFFDEDAAIDKPVVPFSDGLSTVPYTGPTLTIGGELNKLAANVGLGRNMGGVHWRSDAEQGTLLGETIAIQFMREENLTFAETFKGFSLTKFDGTTITV